MLFADTFLNSSFLAFHHWGYIVVFFATAFEATPLFGLFVPGLVITIIAGFAAKLGILDIGDVIVVASAGAILGDFIGYLLGKKYGISFLDRYGKYFFFRKAQFEKTKHFMNENTGKAIVIGRFNSLTRSFAPFVAGATNTPFRKFIMFNIIGGISWATSFVIIGYVFGQEYETASRYIGGVTTIAIVTGIAIAYLYRFIDKRKHIFSKYHLYVLILNIFSLYIFAKMVEDVIDAEAVIKLDVWLNTNVILLWTPYLNKVMIFITNIASPFNLSIFSIFLLLVFVAKKNWHYVVLLTTGMIGGAVLETVIKFIIHRERPINSLIDASGYSFPSGHATMATIFFIILLYILKKEWGMKNKILKMIFILVLILIIFLVGISRIYLNVHWFSDVVAGFALGIFWITSLILIFRFIDSFANKKLYNIKNKFLQ